jgi:monoamine oxidase
VVLEARDRTGGRVWTDRSLGYPVELGAGWIHGPDGNPLVDLAERAGVSTVPMRWDSARVVAADGAAVDGAADEERLATAVEDAAARAEELGEDVPLSELLDEVADDRGWDDAEREGLDRAAVTEIDQEFGAGPDELSAWWWDEGSPFGGEDLLVTGGYDRILAPLADGLDVRLGTPVREVRWSDSGVSLALDDGRLDADAVVVTVPAAVLVAGTPRLDPPLPGTTAAALARLGTGLLDKVVLGFADRAPAEDWVVQWRGDALGDFAEWVDLQAAAGLPAMVAFNAADAARRWESRSDAEIERAALDVLATITPT